ncbi:MAG: ribbon-helix-helix protein, CopG family [Gammaproteobacteria bacterium]|nr:ribbon-helix-helix protein, CopG family [Gammaproteobacteria bacterium]
MSTERYRAFSVTVPPQIEQQLEQLCASEARSRSEVVREALRLYFSTRAAAGGKPVTVVMPAGVRDREAAGFGAFDEWACDLDSVYDVLAKE